MLCLGVAAFGRVGWAVCGLSNVWPEGCQQIKSTYYKIRAHWKFYNLAPIIRVYLWHVFSCDLFCPFPRFLLRNNVSFAEFSSVHCDGNEYNLDECTVGPAISCPASQHPDGVRLACGRSTDAMCDYVDNNKIHPSVGIDDCSWATFFVCQASTRYMLLGLGQN